MSECNGHIEGEPGHENIFFCPECKFTKLTAQLEREQKDFLFKSIEWAVEVKKLITELEQVQGERDKLDVLQEFYLEGIEKSATRIAFLESALETMTAKGVYSSVEAENGVIFEQMSKYLNQFNPKGVFTIVVNWNSAKTIAPQAIKGDKK